MLQPVLQTQKPNLFLLDMRFEKTPVEQLYGDIDAIANNQVFCGNRSRAEAMLRSMQGLLIAKALRNQYKIPIILFASLEREQRKRAQIQLAPIQIIEGLILSDVKNALAWAQQCQN